MSLTGRALTLIALTFLLAIIATWSGDATSVQLWKFPAALILLGVAFEGFIVPRMHISLSLELPRRGYLGRSQPVEFVFRNPSRRPVAIEYAPAMAIGLPVALPTRRLVAPARDSVRDKFDLVPTRLGEVRWPAIAARIRGPLGLAWWSRNLPVDSQFTVGPDLLGDVPKRDALSEQGRSASKARGSGGELLQLRDYQPGDPLHRIDWNATARRGSFVTREYTEDQHLDIILGIDSGRASRLEAGVLDRLGAFANVAARFAEHAIAQDDRIGLVVFAERPLQVLAPARGQPALMRLRRVLESLAPRPAESSLLDAALRVAQLARHRSLVVLFTDLDEAALAGELTRAVRLLQQRHMTVVAGVASEDIIALERRRTRDWIDPYVSLAAREGLARRRANLAALRSRGTQVVSARAKDLEEAVMSAYSRLRRARRI